MPRSLALSYSLILTDRSHVNGTTGPRCLIDIITILLFAHDDRGTYHDVTMAMTESDNVRRCNHGGHSGMLSEFSP